MLRNSLLLIAGVLAWGLASGDALAAAADSIRPEPVRQWSGNVAAVTDYRFRGVSQTNNNPALQAGGDWLYNNALYLGTWTSNVDFNDGSEAVAEWDIYGGVRPKVGPVTVDLGFRQFVYPGSRSSYNLDYLDFVAGLGYEWGDSSFSAGVNYSRDNNRASGESFFWSAELYAPLPHGFRAGAHLGYQSVEDNVRYGLDDYATWTLELGYQFRAVELYAGYVDTTPSKAQCGDTCTAGVVLGVWWDF